MIKDVGTLLGGILLMVIGVADVWTQQKLGVALDTGLILGGAGSLGVHVANRRDDTP